MIDRPVGDLSGGERGRLALLRLIEEGHNTLLLDEPTNHLDIRSRESLEQALADFPGTLIMVSHDRRFLDRLVDRLVVFPEASDAAAGLRVFLGNYGDWQRRRQQEREQARTDTAAAAPISRPGPTTAAPARETPARPTLSKNEQTRRRTWIAEVEEAIAALEDEKDAALAEMSSPACSGERRLTLADRCAAIDQELAAALARWEQWHAELEGTDDP